MRPRITSVGILRAGVQPLFEIGGRGRQDEHADDVGAGLLAQLLGALPVDVEQHVPSRSTAPPRPARAACRSDCRTRRPIPEVRRACDHRFERCLVDEQIVAAVDFARPHRARRCRHRHLQAAHRARISMRDSVVLPAPDGDDSTNISPRRSTPSKPVHAPGRRRHRLTPDSAPVRGTARRRSSSPARYWSVRCRSTSSSRC